MQKFKQRRKGKSPTHSHHTENYYKPLSIYLSKCFSVCVYEYLPMHVEFYEYLLAIYVDIFFANKYTSV